jgi:hypothetical protein
MLPSTAHREPTPRTYKLETRKVFFQVFIYKMCGQERWHFMSCKKPKWNFMQCLNIGITCNTATHIQLPQSQVDRKPPQDHLPLRTFWLLFGDVVWIIPFLHIKSKKEQKDRKCENFAGFKPEQSNQNLIS